MKISRERIGYLEGIVSIILNTFLFVLKYWAGIVSGSIALIADAWHTLSDSISSLVVIAGIKMSVRKPTKKHPFGFGRIEQISALFVAFILGIVAYEIMRESIDKYLNNESSNYGTIAIVVTIISILSKEALAQFSFWAFRKTNYITLRADAWHHRSDALSSVIVLVGIFLRPYIWWVDSLLGIIIALMLFYTVYDIARDAIERLIGLELPHSIVEEIKQIASKAHNGDLLLHHFHIHNYGHHQELTFHMKIKECTTVFDAHEIATKIEKQIFEDLNIESTIHIEPLNNSKANCK